MKSESQHCFLPLRSSVVFLFLFFVYTCRISVPYLQIVKSADGPHRCGRVRFHIEALEVQNDLCHLGCKDDEGALQVVWILIRETRGLNHSVWLSEVSGTFSTCTECNVNVQYMSNNIVTCIHKYHFKTLNENQYFD